jgi:hypothetical protein
MTGRPWPLGGIECLAVGRRRTLAREAHHSGHAGAVDIGIEESHAGALRRERQGEVGRNRGLADAALARGDRHDICDLRSMAAGGIGDECWMRETIS